MNYSQKLIEKNQKKVISESVKVTIIKKEEYPGLCPGKYEVVVRAIPEFMNEPERMISNKEKAEYISQRIKEEFYTFFTK